MKSSAQSIKVLSNHVDETQINPVTKFLPSKVLWGVYKAILIINDVLMTFLALRVAYFVRFQTEFPLFKLDVVPKQPYYFSLAVIIVVLWVIVFTSAGLYNRQNLLGGTDEYSLVARATTIGFLVLIILGFLEPALIVARGWLLLAWGLTFFFAAIGRFVLRRVVYLMRRQGHFMSPTLIVGANDEGLSLGRQLLSWRTSGLNVIGFVDKKLKPGTILFDNVRVLGKAEQLDEIVNQYSVKELVLASSAISSRDSMLDIFQRYGVDSDVNVRMSSGLYEIITTGLTVKEFAYIPLVGVNKVRLTGWDTFLKFGLDYILGIPLLILISPLLLILAIWIKLDSPGPVLHRRRVMGVNNRQFDALKFRSMKINGDEILADYPELQNELLETHKLKDDPRVTRVGKWLRRFSLDELPQVFNVIKRDMSLVGPRIITPEEMSNYSHWGINLLTVKPGMTGLWQVSGRSDIIYKERVRLDMYYIRNWSIWLDLQLLLRTIPVVIRGSGAY